MPEIIINANAEQNIHPVRVLPSDGPLSQPSPGMALCLSGGGYRAMLFHLGTLWRLNEFGLLKGLKRIPSVREDQLSRACLG
jgi:NTE family protein